MLKPILNVCNYILLAGVIVSTVSGCGNKGDLFLIPDALTEQELQRLEQPLGGTEAPAAESISPVNSSTVESTADDLDDAESAIKKKPSSSN